MRDVVALMSSDPIVGAIGSECDVRNLGTLNSDSDEEFWCKYSTHL